MSQVINETIKQLGSTFDNATYSQYLAHLSTSLNNNFYVCQEWAEQLTIELEKIKLKNPKEEKKISAYSQAVANKVVDLVHHKLQEYISTVEDESTLDTTFSI